jgi:hypothetical protein
LEAVTMATHLNFISEQKKPAAPNLVVDDLVKLYCSSLFVVNERIGILIAFLGFLQQMGWLLWKLLAGGHL